jgi:hypothetical protein
MYFLKIIQRQTMWETVSFHSIVDKNKDRYIISYGWQDEDRCRFENEWRLKNNLPLGAITINRKPNG